MLVQAKTKMTSEELMKKICVYLLAQQIMGISITRDSLQMHFNVSSGSISGRVNDLIKLKRVIVTKERKKTTSGALASVIKLNPLQQEWLPYSDLKNIKKASKTITDAQVNEIINETIRLGSTRQAFIKAIKATYDQLY